MGVWFTCNTLSAGLPHNRERIFLIGSYRSPLSHQFYSDGGKLLRDDPPRGKSRQAARPGVRGEFISDAPLLVQRRGGFGYTKATSYCPTIRAQTGKHQGGHTDRPILCGQKLDLERVRETNGVPGRLDGRRGRLIGNAVAPPIAEFIGRRILAIQRSNIEAIRSRMNRSEMMAAVRSKNTKPEMLVRRLAHRMGYRYRLHRPDLPGKPDLVFPSQQAKNNFRAWLLLAPARLPILSHLPKSNASYWVPKLERNRSRDVHNRRKLRKQGWRILVIWECRLRDRDRLKRRLSAFLEP